MERDANGARAQILYTLSDRAEFLFTAEYSNDESGGLVGANALSACGDDIFVVESGLEKHLGWD